MDVGSRTITSVILICDGCRVELPGEHRTGIEARAAAYSEGWRFPARLRAKGADGTRASDVCPTCLPSWQPQRRGEGAGSGNRRADGSDGARVTVGTRTTEQAT